MRAAAAKAVSEESELELEADIANEEQERTRLLGLEREEKKLASMDGRLVQQLEKEVAFDRILLTEAKAAGDDASVTALSGKIESLLAEESRTQQEMLALKRELKELEEVVQRESMKLEAEQGALEVKRNEGNMALSAGLWSAGF